MKLAIHHRKGSYSDRWIDYCQSNDIEYKIVNAFDTDIVAQIKGYDAFMWHHHHGKLEDVLAAKSILFALEHAGVRVFPDFNTGWHFDDKVAQKYLLEAIGAPIILSYIFYDKKQAVDWANSTTYPKVFKLKGGAGSANVSIVRSKYECVKLINTAFGKGFKQFDARGYFLDMLKKYKTGTKSFGQLTRSFGRLFISTEFSKNVGNEKGYAYFQDFIPNNRYDIRIIIIDKKAFGLKRMVRKGDFRASGSGDIVYNTAEIDERCVALAFEVSQRVASECMAYDFIFDADNNPLIVEMSFGFAVKAYDKCEGYWTEDMHFHRGSFNPQAWMVESIINNP
jgi:glutathione synthase/RimK-type ligase-like ATP-grasp enzyme